MKSNVRIVAAIFIRVLKRRVGSVVSSSITWNNLDYFFLLLLFFIFISTFWNKANRRENNKVTRRKIVNFSVFPCSSSGIVLKPAFSIIYYLLIIYISRVSIYIYIVGIQVESTSWEEVLDRSLGGTRDDRSTVRWIRIQLFAIVDRSSKILERNSTIMVSMI